MTPTPPPTLSGTTPVVVAPPITDATIAGVSTRRTPIRTLARHFWLLEPWKKALVALAVVCTIVGIAGSVGGYVRPKPPERVQARQTIETLAPQAAHSSLTAEQQTQYTSAVQTVQNTNHWFYDQAAPQLWRIGLGFAVAFVLGYMARQFVKTVATLLAVILFAAGVAIYFGKLDGTKVTTDLKSGTGWVADRLDTWKDQAVTLLSTSLSGTAGFVIGFTRKRG